MSQPTQERLAFSFSQTVPARAAALPPTFATAQFSEPRDWGYTGLIAFTAVLLIRPQDTFPALTPLRLAEVCAFIGLAPMLLHRLARRLPVFRVTRETLGVFVLGGTMLLTVPFSIWPGGAFGAFTETFVKIATIFVLMLNTLTSVRRIERISWLILMCCGYVAARGVFDYARGVNLIEGGRLAGAISGIFGNPNDLALNMVSVLPIAAVAALSSRNSTFWRITAAVIGLMMMATIIFTKSRGGALGFLVVVLAMIMLSKTLRPAIAIAVIAGTMVATPFMPASFWSRISTIFDEERDANEFTGSREQRATLLREGLRAFSDYPLTGVGAGQFRNYNYPGRVEQSREAHNALVQVAADLGIFGLAVMVFLIYCGIHTAMGLRRRLGPQPRRRGLTPEARSLTDDEREALYGHSIALGAGLIGWFVCAQFASVAYSWTFYYLLALTVAARELIRDRMAGAPTEDTGAPQETRRHSIRTHRPVTA